MLSRYEGGSNGGAGVVPQFKLAGNLAKSGEEKGAMGCAYIAGDGAVYLEQSLLVW